MVSRVSVFFITNKPAAAQQRDEPVLESIKQGFRFVWKSREILGTMSLDLFAVFFGGATALLPYFADVIRGKIKVEDYNLYSLNNNMIVAEILDAARKSTEKGGTVFLGR